MKLVANPLRIKKTREDSLLKYASVQKKRLEHDRKQRQRTNKKLFRGNSGVVDKVDDEGLTVEGLSIRLALRLKDKANAARNAIFYHTAKNGQKYAFNKNTGKKVWVNQSKSPRAAGPAATPVAPVAPVAPASPPAHGVLSANGNGRQISVGAGLRLAVRLKSKAGDARKAISYHTATKGKMEGKSFSYNKNTGQTNWTKDAVSAHKTSKKGQNIRDLAASGGMSGGDIDIAEARDGQRLSIGTGMRVAARLKTKAGDAQRAISYHTASSGKMEGKRFSLNKNTGKTTWTKDALENLQTVAQSFASNSEGNDGSAAGVRSGKKLSIGTGVRVAARLKAKASGAQKAISYHTATSGKMEGKKFSFNKNTGTTRWTQNSLSSLGQSAGDSGAAAAAGTGGRGKISIGTGVRVAARLKTKSSDAQKAISYHTATSGKMQGKRYSYNKKTGKTAWNRVESAATTTKDTSTVVVL